MPSLMRTFSDFAAIETSIKDEVFDKVNHDSYMVEKAGELLVNMHVILVNKVFKRNDNGLPLESNLTVKGQELGCNYV